VSGNISLLLLSSLFVSVITIYLYYKWPDLDLIDLYIIFVGLHFGLSPFIRGLHFGGDVIFDFRNSSPLPLSLVFLQVLITLVIIRACSLYLFPGLMNYLKIRYLVSLWYQTNRYVLFFVYFWLILFQIISYYKYGVITYITPDDFARFGKHLPYWYTSMRTIYNYMAFCVFIGLFAYIVNSSKYQQYLLIILILIFAPIATIFGRRYFIEMIISAMVFWFAYKKENIFRLRYLTVGLVLFCAFFLFSNLFQAYRDIFQSVGKIETNKLENPFSAAFNINLTIRNFTLRPGTWEFNYLVINNQLNKNGMTTKGKVNFEGLKSSIPRFFWPEKQISYIDDILSKLYNVKPREIDIGKNLFGVWQVDFGYYSILIVSIIVLMLIYLLGTLVKIITPYPTFLWLLSGNIIFFLINIEGNGNELFFMLRNIIIILILLAVYIISYKMYSTFWNKIITTRRLID
jgi:hypothetical protein